MITGLYERVSTDMQVEKGYSISEQDCKLKALCAAQELGEYKVYLDDGYSGKDMNRPALQELLRDAKSGKIKNIVIYKLDRLSRSLRDTLEIIEDIIVPKNIRLISLTENLDTSTPVGRLVISILSAFAELERETIKDRMQMGRIGRAKTGKWRGSKLLPFGYDYDREKGILVPNADASKVKQLYNLYLQGLGLAKIAKLLGLYSQTTAARILENKVNLGFIRYKEKYYKGQHEPIISKEIYNQAIAMRQQRKCNTEPKKKRLLAGLIICGKCGAKMSYCKRSNNSITKIKCYSQQHIQNLIKDPDCNNPDLTMTDVENAVLNILFNMTCDSNDTKGSPCGDNDIFGQLRSQYEETVKGLKRLYNLYSESEDDLLLDTINESKKKLAELQTQIDLENELKEINAKSAIKCNAIKSMKDSWAHWSGNQKNEAVRSYIDKIIITDGIMEIYWLSNNGIAETINIEREQKNIYDKFIFDCMSENKAAKCQATKFYKAYLIWCQKEGFQPCTKRRFFEEFRGRGNLMPYITVSYRKCESNVIVGWELKEIKP